MISFPCTWSTKVLTAAPLIAPARSFVYPQQIPGEEDALARGAMQLMVRPAAGGDFLATCALGFADPSLPTGVWSSPNPNEICALAGGYAYLIDASAPAQCELLNMRPVVEVRALPEQGLLLFAGFHTLLARSASGFAWQTQRLSWEGLRLAEITGDEFHGFGWDLMRDQEVAFTVDLKTGAHTGGSAPGTQIKP